MTAAAQKCFNENLRLIGKTPNGAPTDPQAWNLNQGLLDLARSIADVQAKLAQLENEVRYIRTNMR